MANVQVPIRLVKDTTAKFVFFRDGIMNYDL